LVDGNTGISIADHAIFLCGAVQIKLAQRDRYQFAIISRCNKFIDSTLVCFVGAGIGGIGTDLYSN
jgi:hypothetical protein